MAPRSDPRRSLMTNHAWKLRDDLIATDVTESIVALDLDNAAYYGVESTGRRIWQLLEEPQTIDSLVTVLTEEYEVPADRCAASVRNFLVELEGLDLVVPASLPT